MKSDGQHGRGPRQHGRAGPGAEHGLTAAAAERARDVARAPLLKQDRDEEEQAHQHVHGNQQVVEHPPIIQNSAAPVTIAKNEGTVRLAPPTSAPSTSCEGHQVLDVVGLHAAAVEHVARRRPPPGRTHRAKPRPDVRVRLAGLRRRGVAPGPDGPHRFVGDHERRRPGPACRPSSAASICRSSTASVWFASRSSSVSPMQTIGVRSLASDGAELAVHRTRRCRRTAGAAPSGR